MTQEGGQQPVQARIGEMFRQQGAGQFAGISGQGDAGQLAQRPRQALPILPRGAPVSWGAISPNAPAVPGR